MNEANLNLSVWKRFVMVSSWNKLLTRKILFKRHDILKLFEFDRKFIKMIWEEIMPLVTYFYTARMPSEIVLRLYYWRQFL